MMEPRAVKITRKGQVTIPKRIRDFLKSDVVKFDVIDNKVVVVPVESAAGSLSKYAKGYTPIEGVRDAAWKEAMDAKFGPKAP
jgi:bifunctional DNA-binding transcriptional regulator/antitoxin component of YhaV-PrlF toxin-antitoxin module